MADSASPSDHGNPPEGQTSAWPALQTSTIGRRSETALAKQLLQDGSVRLLTLVGPGGVGKTRLCTKITEAVAGEFDRRIFVDLSSVNEAEQMVQTIGRSLGIVDVGEISFLQRMAIATSGQRILLALDNLEQIRGAGAAIGQLLSACTGITILATSRNPLHISVEHELPVEPFETDDAVALFAVRARSISPAFSISDDNSDVVAAICEHLDGLPLAIELAAARIKMLSVTSLLEQVTLGIDILNSGPVDAPERQQALSSTIQWSYDLLEQDARQILRYLSVYSGSFNLESASAILAPLSRPDLRVADVIFTLIDSGLLKRQDHLLDTSTDTRFVMLETVRAFAKSKFEQEDNTSEMLTAHATWFRDFTERGGREIEGPSAVDWISRIDHELPNIRSALHWFVENEQANDALRLSGALWLYWMVRGGLNEGRDWIDLAITVPGADPRIASRAIATAGFLASNQGDYAYANQIEESLETSRSLGDIAGEGIALLALGDMACDQNDHHRAIELLEASLELFEQVGDHTRIAMTLVNLGGIAGRMGAEARAVRYSEEAAYVSRDIGFVLAICYSTNLLGRHRRREGRFSEADALYHESLESAWKLQVKTAIAIVLLEGGSIAATAGQLDRAAYIWGAAEALRQSIGFPKIPSAAHAAGVDYDRLKLRVEKGLGAEQFDEQWTKGKSAQLADAVQVGLQVTSAKSESAAQSPWRLSNRETEVLDLMLDGMTNREISEHLFISLRTAEGHVANLLSKLGVANRGAAIALASRQRSGESTRPS